MGKKGDKVGYKKPPKSGQIKKGEVRNPKGGGSHKFGKVPKRLRELTKEQLKEVGDLVLSESYSTLDEIYRTRKTNNVPALKVWMASVITTAIDSGSAYQVDCLLNRLLGKPPERMEHTGKDGAPIEYTEEELEARKKRIAETYDKLKALDAARAEK